ncbi:MULTISPECIES: hypothetical protein [unclassified Azospirillum]|uniref:hypothetical protein n=1 Tax=unclassified Azospirillum TaxID=2630922 RepID=UPI0011B25704|nr:MULTISPECIES: hypothetical protein [unclassified Azospirillum]
MTTAHPTPWKIVKTAVDYASPGRPPDISISYDVRDANGRRVYLTGDTLEYVVRIVNSMGETP